MQWKAKFENCKFENGKFIKCEIDTGKIKSDFKEHETAIFDSAGPQFFADMENFNVLLKQLESLQTAIDSIKANKEKVKADMKVNFYQNLMQFR